MQLFQKSLLKDCMRFPCKPRLSMNPVQYTPRSNFISCTTRSRRTGLKRSTLSYLHASHRDMVYIANREAPKRQRMWWSPTRLIHHSVFVFSMVCNLAQNQKNQAVDPESWFQLQCCALAVWLYTLKAGKQGTQIG
jgi:hypothetical protein